jgi:hypothetical protein
MTAKRKRSYNEAQKAQRRLMNQALYKKKRTLILEQKAEYYKENKSLKAEKAAAYYLKTRSHQRAQQAEYYKESKERRAEYREANKPRAAAYYRANKAHLNALCSAHYRANVADYNARVAKRRAAKLQATPPWLTPLQIEHIKLFYEASAQMQKETGLKFHVDHITALQGKEVCGLHVPWNLQILPASENISKGNRLVDPSTNT